MRNALRVRLKSLERRLPPTDRAFRGILTFDSRTKGPAAAVARATLPGITYVMDIDEGDRHAFGRRARHRSDPPV